MSCCMSAFNWAFPKTNSGPRSAYWFLGSVGGLLNTPQESIQPNFVFLRFLIFALKLECLWQIKNNVLTIKWPSLTAKKRVKESKVRLTLTGCRANICDQGLSNQVPNVVIVH